PSGRHDMIAAFTTEVSGEPGAGQPKPPARPIDTTDIALGDATPCANPACKAPARPLAAKPRKWPWASRCWNCNVELRRP
ncbi:MAG TPA: hypothetical protein VN213_01780, partial [Solirubrobacteraceae bacterium]|nr:hypothetical protein [Solirubrobacteraceae bacterium]